MAWVAVDKDGSEFIFHDKPVRIDICGFNVFDTRPGSKGYYVELPKGTIKKLIGRDLTWEDDAVELKNE